MKLKSTFLSLCEDYCSDKELVGKLWNEITESYNQKGRHYHDLKHLENLLAELEACRSFIQDWNAVLFV
ncbi:MAG: hypothetical protein AB8F95_10265, partial [Bacteroidia bacterium]